MSVDDIVGILQARLAETSGALVDPDVPYAGVAEIDSFDVLELVLFAEKTFALKFQPSDLESDAFTTLSGMAALIGAKTAVS